MTVSRSRHYIVHCKATEKEVDQGKDIWNRNCGCLASDTVGRRCRLLHKTQDRAGRKQVVCVYATQEGKRYKLE